MHPILQRWDGLFNQTEENQFNISYASNILILYWGRSNSIRTWQSPWPASSSCWIHSPNKLVWLTTSKVPGATIRLSITLFILVTRERMEAWKGIRESGCGSNRLESGNTKLNTQALEGYDLDNPSTRDVTDRLVQVCLEATFQITLHVPSPSSYCRLQYPPQDMHLPGWG